MPDAGKIVDRNYLNSASRRRQIYCSGSTLRVLGRNVVTFAACETDGLTPIGVKPPDDGVV
jgi:hypothetical protein